MVGGEPQVSGLVPAARHIPNTPNRSRTVKEFNRRRKRRMRLSALGKYLLVFVLGGLVTLAVLPYFTAGVVNRVTEVQGTIDERASEWIPGAEGRATLLRLVDPSRLSFDDTSTGSTKGPVDDPKVPAINDKSVREFELITNIASNDVQTEIKELRVVKTWSGTKNRRIKFSPPKSPFFLIWDHTKVSALGTKFQIGWIESNIPDSFLGGLGEIYRVSGTKITGSSNFKLIEDSGEVEIIVTASGISWELIAAVEP